MPRLTIPNAASGATARRPNFKNAYSATNPAAAGPNTRIEMVMPGDNVAMTVNLITPIAMDEGLRFAIREGGRTVGAGVVSAIIE